MKDINYDVAVIGAGPAGLAAAASAKENGAKKVVVIERDFRPGGILEQCVHAGFGLKYFNEELSGPEYAMRFIKKCENDGIEFMVDTMVLNIDSKEMVIHAVHKKGLVEIHAGAIILAMGCRERTRQQIQIPGSRPAGIYTAGTAQRFCNVQNHIVGNKIVIVGSGDIGMIMARRMTLEGSEVKGVFEIMPYLAGLTRNRVQCLDDFGIPLYLSHTVIDIDGKYRVKKVTVAKVDENKKPIPGTEFDVECDTVLLSVGLIPENEVSKTAGVRLDPITKGPVVDNTMMTNVSGIFACGNVVHVNDLVDNVSRESELAGKSAAAYAAGAQAAEETLQVEPGDFVRYVVPQVIDRKASEDVRMFFRATEPMQDVVIQVKSGDKVLSRRKKQFVNPGEMDNIRVKAENLADAAGSGVTVSIVRQ
ncbi:MAG: NAD(P)/FAD-dependent oxidoreductase [Anaerovoracaceae bacterium]